MSSSPLSAAAFYVARPAKISREKPKAPRLPDGFHGTNEVSKLVGATHRQLQWWDEMHVLSPRQVAHSRAYSSEQVAILKTIVRLRRCGFSLQKIRKLLRDPAWGKVGPYFVVCRTVVHAATSAEDAIAKMVQLRVPCVLVIRDQRGRESARSGLKTSTKVST